MLIDIAGIQVELIRKPIKNITIRVYPPLGEVRVSAPLRMSMSRILNVLETKHNWILKQQAKLQSRPVTVSPKLETGEHHYFLGQAYPLFVIENSLSTKIILDQNRFLLSVQPNAILEEKKFIFNQWYKKQLAAIVPPLIAKWEPIIDVSVTNWRSRIMKTRWGSCNIRTRQICLNLALIKKPLACIEYVLVHEMVHLLEASHNKRFYQFMDQFLPQWREHKNVIERC